MNLITQPPSSSLCGQACVAMAAGISLQESIKIFGHKHSTTTIHVARALNALGIQTHYQRLKRFKKAKSWPRRAIIKQIYGFKGKRHGHWVLLWDGKIYDPSPDDLSSLGWPKEALGKLSSYLELL